MGRRERNATEIAHPDTPWGRLRQLKIEQGLTYGEIEQRSGVSRSYVNRIFLGQVIDPDGQIVSSLCSAVGTSPENIGFTVGPQRFDYEQIILTFERIERTLLQGFEGLGSRLTRIEQALNIQTKSEE